MPKKNHIVLEYISCSAVRIVNSSIQTPGQVTAIITRCILNYRISITYPTYLEPELF
jgi:hypothetical protein